MNKGSAVLLDISNLDVDISGVETTSSLDDELAGVESDVGKSRCRSSDGRERENRC